MTDFSITLSNNLKFYSTGELSYWGVMVWGSDVWGSDSDQYWSMGKVVASTLTFDSQISVIYDAVRTIGSTLTLDSTISRVYDAVRTIDNTLTIDSDIIKSFTRAFTNTLVVASDPAILYLTDANGYLLYSLGESDLEERRFPVYTEQGLDVVSYTTQTGANTDWS